MDKLSISPVVYEDDHFVAVNKPSGLLTIPDRFDDTKPSLYKMLEKKYSKIFIVHRLDKETSGLILFAKDEKTHKYLSQLFEQRNVEKYYLGIVLGSLSNKKGIIEVPVEEHPSGKGIMMASRKGKLSITEYEEVEDYGLFSLVKFRIQTGRTHQIRVHMKYLCHPLACDELYGDGKPVLVSSFKRKYKLSDSELEERPILSRLALHSYQLIFTDQDGKHFDLKAEMPKDMRALTQQLQKNKK
jgi:23S rRNA pseudouridine1911/1915/1917 synthase